MTLKNVTYWIGISTIALCADVLFFGVAGTALMGSVWLTTRAIDRFEREAIDEAKHVEERRETGRDQQTQEQPKTWAYDYELDPSFASHSEEAIEQTRVAIQTIPTTTPRYLRVRPAVATQYEDQQNR